MATWVEDKKKIRLKTKSAMVLLKLDLTRISSFVELKIGSGRNSANMVDTVGERHDIPGDGRKETPLTDISNLIRQELTKLLGNKPQPGSGDMNLNHAHFADSAGIMLQHTTDYALTSIECIDAGSWILDSGASRHMCAYSNQMSDIIDLDKPLSVLLPDGTTTSVTKSGVQKSTFS
ncbi:hypothetical protein DH2020_024658 [Rehmannia glutinosa]|uniref:Uncharacterized protein n=1 Tax=Rehmannia glutinosa TaxID=99300 RepID=A0ABR0W2N4_REHGL